MVNTLCTTLTFRLKIKEKVMRVLQTSLRLVWPVFLKLKTLCFRLITCGVKISRFTVTVPLFLIVEIASWEKNAKVCSLKLFTGNLEYRANVTAVSGDYRCQQGEENHFEFEALLKKSMVVVLSEYRLMNFLLLKTSLATRFYSYLQSTLQ